MSDKHPDGMTCKQCINYARCNGFLGEQIEDWTNCDWIPSKFRYNWKLKAEELEAEVEGLRAQVAVMKEALEAARDYLPGILHTRDIGQCKKCGRSVSCGTIKYCRHCVNEIVKQALSPTAGQEMLEKMRKLETVVEAAKALATWMQWWLDEDLCDCEDGHICGRIQRQQELDRFRKALAALEGGNEDE